MLARIEQLEEIEWAACEATGRFLAIRARAGSPVEAAAARVEQALGPRGRRAPEALARSQLAAYGRGDPWFTARDAHALSYVEGRLVAVRVADEVGHALELPRATREALAEVVRAVFFGVLERVHAEGGRESSGWFYAEWPRIAAAAAARLEGQVADPGALAARLAGCFTRSG